MSIIEITGRGEQRGITLEHRGKKVEVDTLPVAILSAFSYISIRDITP